MGDAAEHLGSIGDAQPPLYMREREAHEVDPIRAVSSARIASYSGMTGPVPLLRGAGRGKLPGTSCGVARWANVIGQSFVLLTGFVQGDCATGSVNCPTDVVGAGETDASSTPSIL